jgi:UDP-N-acetylmuramate-alanine ligase
MFILGVTNPILPINDLLDLGCLEVIFQTDTNITVGGAHGATTRTRWMVTVALTACNITGKQGRELIGRCRLKL